jgi:hypothetical protein
VEGGDRWSVKRAMGHGGVELGGPVGAWRQLAAMVHGGRTAGASVHVQEGPQVV